MIVLSMALAADALSAQPTVQDAINALLAAKQKSQTEELKRPPRPLGRPGDWMSDEDYPALALHNAISGTTGFVLTIDANGVPSDCVVTLSSGDVLLDETTCSLIKQRARFSPALDDDGKPTTGTFSSKVRWNIPTKTLPVPKPGKIEITFDVLPNGTRANCRVSLRGELAKQPNPENSEHCGYSVYDFEPPTDSAGRPVTKHIVQTMQFTVTESPAGNGGK